MKRDFTLNAVDIRNGIRSDFRNCYCEIKEDLDGRYNESSEVHRVKTEIEKVNETIDYLYLPDSDNPNYKPILTYEKLKANKGVIYFVLDQFELRNVIPDSFTHVQVPIHEIHNLVYLCRINEVQ